MDTMVINNREEFAQWAIDRAKRSGLIDAAETEVPG